MPYSPFIEVLFPEFEAAAGKGAVLELKMRILAGKIPSLQEHAHSDRLKDLEDSLIKHFRAELSEEERKTLRLCRQLRNKVLHSDFHAARNTLNELGMTPSPAGVVQMSVPENLTMDKMEKMIEAVKAGTEGTRIADTGSTGEGGVFGWLLEAGSSGDFRKAHAVFEEAVSIVERLTGIEPA